MQIETMRAFTAQAIKHMLKAADALYGLNLSTKCKVSLTTRKARSHGGTRNYQPVMSIHLGYYFDRVKADGSMRYWEYEHIKADAEIGEGEMHWTQAVVALLAHEVAHVVQMYDRFNNASCIAKSAIERQGNGHEMTKKNQAEHGADWQAIYRELRTFMSA